MTILIKRFGKGLFVILMILSCRILMAQPTNLGQAPVIAGIQCQCFGIPTIVVPGLSDVAMAVPGQGILLNPNFFSMPPSVQLFTYAHECAHFTPQVGSNENAADCMAAGIGRVQGWLSVQGINDFCAYFANNPGNWSHAPGPVRCQNVIACYNNP